MNFLDLPLPDELLSAVADLGFTTPTQIQEEAIPALIDGRDVVGIAQTGTGKTAAFGLPLLAAISSEPGLQALVLAPTRELAQQSAKAIESFAQSMPDVGVVCVYGGSPYGPQIGALRHGVQVCVGTPGRIIDLMDRGELVLDNLRFFVLDEADEMLRMGFAEDVERISADIPADAHKALFSATMPPAILRVADQYLNDPVSIEVAPQSSTVETVAQTYAVVPFKFKMEALSRVLATMDAEAAIVFVRTRADAEGIATDLQQIGIKAAALSGDVAQDERERIIARLRSGKLDVLVATDVAARGLDVERLGLVVNYDVPREAEAYVHRIGRTGRAGREGRALTFFTPRERYRLTKIEKLTGTPMEETHVPSPAQVSDFRAQALLERCADRLETGEMDVYYHALQDAQRTTGMDIGDLAAALLALAAGDLGPEPSRKRGHGRIRREEEVDEYGRFVSATFEGGRDKAPKQGRVARTNRRQSSRHPALHGARKYRIEVGKRDGVSPGAIVGAITGEGGIPGKALGAIDIFPSFSLVEIAGLEKKQAARISRARVAGRSLRIREDSGPKHADKRRFNDDRGAHKERRGKKSSDR
ncbi:MAG: DEAD/DEAH box helicase [Actinomycetaceae bacterium]|nr:DEAD/DEAH box helicase [Actinomycetaceae bacterium]MDU0969463.1 DEAD/DEAH box helicase [Actinomycetaceae bacterium]